MRDAEAQWMVAMRHGDFPAAWAISDAVLKRRNPATRDDPTQPYHRRWVWDGQPFHGRHVLVRCYHGLGDTLQFLRYLPALRCRTASVTLEVQPELINLLAGYPGIDHLIPFRVDAPHPPSACDLEIMELAHALRIPPPALPPPYLRVRPAQGVAAAIGLCWQAGGWDSARTIPRTLLAPILSQGRPFISLVPEPSGTAFLNPAGCDADIGATAALVAGLRLVITVDTMVAHLAGALGQPAWLLLKHDADWRWGDGIPTSPWYPAMRVFRQPAPGDWRPVIAAVEQQLSALPATAQVRTDHAHATARFSAPEMKASVRSRASSSVN